jgi:hypothetical protein
MATNSNPIRVDSDSHTAQGILMMLGAVLATCFPDGRCPPTARADLPAHEVSCLRGLASIRFSSCSHRNGPVAGVVPVRWLAHVLRGGLSIHALDVHLLDQQLSLSTAYGIVLCAPLLIIALSASPWGNRSDGTDGSPSSSV